MRFFIRPAFEVAARVLTLHPPPHPTPLNPNPPTPIRPRPRPQPVRHSYGKTLVPFNKIDEEQMSVANEKCMSILGFAKSSEVRGGRRCAGLSRRHGSLTRTPKGGSNTGPRRSRKSSWSATRSRFRPSRRTLSPTRRCRPSSTPFTSSTASRSCATAAPTVRGGSLSRNRVPRHLALTATTERGAARTGRQPPKLGVLTPHIRARYECLLYSALPFAEDVRLYKYAARCPCLRC